MNIAILVGHGGKDSGAVANGMLEKDINLEVGLQVFNLLKGKGHTVGINRTRDIFVEISDQVAYAKAMKADIAVCIHHNAGGGKGYDVIYEIDQPETKKLADSIATEFEKAERPRHSVFTKANTYKTDDYFGVLRNGKMLGIITEYAFMDSKDHESIDTKAERAIEANCIASGVLKYIEKSKK